MNFDDDFYYLYHAIKHSCSGIEPTINESSKQELNKKKSEKSNKPKIKKIENDSEEDYYDQMAHNQSMH